MRRCVSRIPSVSSPGPQGGRENKATQRHVVGLRPTAMTLSSTLLGHPLLTRGKRFQCDQSAPSTPSTTSPPPSPLSPSRSISSPSPLLSPSLSARLPSAVPPIVHSNRDLCCGTMLAVVAERHAPRAKAGSAGLALAELSVCDDAESRTRWPNRESAIASARTASSVALAAVAAQQAARAAFKTCSSARVMPLPAAHARRATSLADARRAHKLRLLSGQQRSLKFNDDVSRALDEVKAANEHGRLTRGADAPTLDCP